MPKDNHRYLRHIKDMPDHMYSDPERRITVDEAAMLSGRSRNTLLDQLRAGDIPHIKVGPGYRIKRGDIIAMIENETVA